MHGNGNVQANVRANNSGQFEGTAHEDLGFRGNKGQEVHPNFALNITMEFHYHAFCAPERKHELQNKEFGGVFGSLPFLYVLVSTAGLASSVLEASKVCGGGVTCSLSSSLHLVAQLDWGVQ